MRVVNHQQLPLWWHDGHAECVCAFVNIPFCSHAEVCSCENEPLTCCFCVFPCLSIPHFDVTGRETVDCCSTVQHKDDGRYLKIWVKLISLSLPLLATRHPYTPRSGTRPLKMEEVWRSIQAPSLGLVGILGCQTVFSSAVDLSY